MEKTRNQVIDRLLELKVFKRQPFSPFLWANGWKSPVYYDDKKILSYPKTRDFFKLEIAHSIMENFPEADAIAAVATNAIAQGVLVAEQLNLPFVYIYPTPKNHGLENQIEGDVRPGQKVVVIENQVSLGVNAIAAVDALRMSGCQVLGVITILDFELPTGHELFRKKEVPLVALAKFTDALDKALTLGHLTQSEYKEIKKWHANPTTYYGRDKVRK